MKLCLNAIIETDCIFMGAASSVASVAVFLFVRSLVRPLSLIRLPVCRPPTRAHSHWDPKIK